MQGVCDSPPEGTVSIEGILEEYPINDPEPWQAPRCVLLTNDTFLQVEEPGLWIDSLHIQIVAGSTSVPNLVGVSYTGAAFITNCVFQGDSTRHARAFRFGGSVMGAYVQGVHY